MVVSTPTNQYVSPVLEYKINCLSNCIVNIIGNKNIEEKDLYIDEKLLCLNISGTGEIYSNVNSCIENSLKKIGINKIRIPNNEVFKRLKYGEKLLVKVNIKYLEYAEVYNKFPTSHMYHFVSINMKRTSKSIFLYDSYIPTLPISEYLGEINRDHILFTNSEFYSISQDDRKHINYKKELIDIYQCTLKNKNDIFNCIEKLFLKIEYLSLNLNSENKYKLMNLNIGIAASGYMNVIELFSKNVLTEFSVNCSIKNEVLDILAELNKNFFILRVCITKIVLSNNIKPIDELRNSFILIIRYYKDLLNILGDVI